MLNVSRLGIPRDFYVSACNMINVLKIYIPSFASQFEYDQYKELADDREKLHAELSAYEMMITLMKRKIELDGSFVVRGPLILSDMVKWLKKNNYENSGKYRSLYYAEQAKLF